MKRMGAVFITVLLLFALALPAAAETEVTTMRFHATVSADGSCQVTVSVNLRLETAQKELTFPVPTDARNITLNGAKVDTAKRNEAKQIDLSDTIGTMAGEFTFTVNYILDDVVTKNSAGLPMLELPMLSGFAYPLANLEFSVSLPADIEAKPAFSSGYHQSSIEQDLYASVSGNLVNGYALKSLKDHETLVMTLDVREDMFPDMPISLNSPMVGEMAVGAVLLLGLLYWLLFLRTGPLYAKRSPIPPEGFGAGELGSLLALQGADLTMMVFTWGQLGYVLIQPDRNGRVLLHKRMEMGNERSEFEQRLFKALFGKRQVVDATSGRYADLCLKAQTLSSGARSMLLRRSGNPRLFRLIAGIGAMICGFFVGFRLSDGGFLQWFCAVILAALGGWSAWQIHGWAASLFLLRKRALWKAMAWCVCWLALGWLAQEWGFALILVLSQLLTGLMAAYGGRRTEEGRRVAAQVLGLRKYLKTLSRQDIRRLTDTDPEFFHNMAPYALALGVDRAFAKRFGHEGISGCPYLTTGMDGHCSARQWCELMRATASDMDRRNRQRGADRLRRLLSELKK